MVRLLAIGIFSIVLLNIPGSLSVAETIGNKRPSSPKSSKSKVRKSSGFRQLQIGVGRKKIVVEMAVTENQRAQGLMYRKNLGKNKGMLFVFEEEQILSFWMKNTYISLSIGFFDKDKKLLEIKKMKPMKSAIQVNFPSYKSSKPARYALEMNMGWFEKNKIKPGAMLTGLE